jgi:putative hemolysin
MAGSGRFSVTIGRGPGDIEAAQALRTRAFATQEGDGDRFDDLCDHLLVRDCRNDAVVCSARILACANGQEISQSYSAQYYDLSALTRYRGRMAELGRFCIDPEGADHDILRIAWGALTRYVDDNNIEMLFGCSSFAGTDTSVYLDAFALLRDRYLAPPRWGPGVRSGDVFRYGADGRVPDVRRGMRMMPPLLRSYLLMGGWVSDHAVVDRQMNTLHVFTGLEIDAIPAARKRLLRADGAEI